MLALQRNIDFNQIGVIVINDGEESRLPDEVFDGYPYDIRNYTIKHGGVSAARNAGIDRSEAEWVMICDFDDTFLSVNALHILLTAAKDEKRVMYWSHFMEEIDREGEMIYHVHERDYIFNHGKMFRRQWLLDNNIRFNERLTLHEDVFFNTLTQAVAKEEEIGEIQGSIYLWCWNPNSVSRLQDNWLIKTFDHMMRQRIAICQELEDREMKKELEMVVVKTFIDSYYDFQQEEWQKTHLVNEKKYAERWFCTFMRTYWDVYKNVNPLEIAGMARVARNYRVSTGRLMMEAQTLREFLLHINELEPIPANEWNL